MACRKAKARGKCLIALNEVYPGEQDIVILNDVRCNAGRCSSGDVVSFLHNGKMELGELLLTVGIQKLAGPIVESFISLWQPKPTESSDKAWYNFNVSGDNVVKVPTRTSIDSVLTYRLSTNKESCAVYLPPEIRPR